MDPFTIRLLIGCLVIWLVAKLWAAINSAFTKNAPASAWVWFVFVALVALWVFFATKLPFHPN